MSAATKPRGKAGLERPTCLVAPDGGQRFEALSPDAQVALYARVVHRGQAGLVELVRALRQGDGSLRMRSRRDPRHYLQAGDAHALVRLAGLARGRGEEVFVTPLPREAPEPGKAAVRGGSALWVDLDSGEPELTQEIRALRPALWLSSGAGHHLYWRLDREVDGVEVEELNRRLCHRLGGDMACTERGRIMRLPGTFNQKRGRWCSALRADLGRPAVSAEALRSALPDPQPPRPARPPGESSGAQAGRQDDPLCLIAPPVYFRALARVDVPAEGGMVRCPLPGHDDGYASCQVWADAEQGWWCFGCSRGGRVFDLASCLAGGPCGYELRGEAFRAALDVAKATLA